MNRNSKWFVLASIFVFPAVVWGAEFTQVRDNITRNTEWTKKKSPYVIQGDITISRGAILTIDPGVEVRFGALAGDKAGSGPNLVVRGGLRAVGSLVAPIYFYPAQKGNIWGSIYFDGSDPANSVLESCDIKGGRVLCSNASPTITSCNILEAQTGVEVGVNSNPRIIHNRINSNSKGVALVSDSASPVIRDNEIRGNNYGFYLQDFGAPVITKNRIYGNLKYNVVNYSPKSISFADNDFQLTDSHAIARTLYDKAFDPKLGRVDFTHPDGTPSVRLAASKEEGTTKSSIAPQSNLNRDTKSSDEPKTAGFSLSADLLGKIAYSDQYVTPFDGFGLSLFADYRFTPDLSLGLGLGFVEFPGVDGIQTSWVDLGGRFFPFEASRDGEVYLQGGFGMTPLMTVIPTHWQGRFHATVGLGYRFFMDKKQALDLGADYDIFSPRDTPLQNMGVKVGLTWFLGA